MSDADHSERSTTSKRVHSLIVVLLFGLFILPALSGEEPTLDGAYFRMMCEYGSYYGRPPAELMESYSEMAKVGCDGIYSSHLFLSETSMARCADSAKMTTEEYFHTITELVEKNGLSVWPVFRLQSGANLIDPDAKDEIISSAKAFAERFAALPHFRGLAYDEPSALNCYSSACLTAFKAFLLKRHSPDQLQDLGLGALTNADVSIMSPAAVLMLKDSPKLSDAYSLYCQEMIAKEEYNASVNEKASEAEITGEAFREWLVAKYSMDELQGMGATAAVRSDTKVILPDRNDGRLDRSATGKLMEQSDIGELLDEETETEKSVTVSEKRNVVLPARYEENPVLFMEYEEFAGRQFEDVLAGIEAAVREVSPDAITFPIISFMQILHTPFRASVARLGRTCGAISVDPYWDGAQEEGFWAKLMRGQSRGPSFLTISAGKYGTGPERFARDLSLCAVHSPAVNIFAWVYAWNEPPEYSPGTASVWKDGNFDVLVRIFGRIEKVMEYLTPSSSTARVALVYSERDSMWDQAGNVAWPRKGGFVANCYGLHCAFAQAGIQYEPVFEQFITEAELGAFTVVILPGNTYISPDSVSAIEAWVKSGGSLIAFGDVGKKDRWGRVTEESPLKHLLGLADARTTTCTSFLLNTDVCGELGVQYRSGLPAFGYVLASASELGVWEDGTTAVAVNKVGDGLVYSVGAERLGVCYQGSGGGRRFPVRKAFSPGILEFLNEIVTLAMGDNKDEQVLQGVKCPVHTEVTVRSQPGRNIVHLINFDSHNPLVEQAQVMIRVPPGAEPVVFYPEDMSLAEYKVVGRDVSVKVRDFDVYELFVVQYEGNEPEKKDACQGVFILPTRKVVEE